MILNTAIQVEVKPRAANATGIYSFGGEEDGLATQDCTYTQQLEHLTQQVLLLLTVAPLLEPQM